MPRARAGRKRKRLLGIELDGLTQIGDRSVGVVQARERPTAADVGQSAFGIESNRFAEFGDSPRVIVHVLPECGQVDVNLAASLVPEPNGLLAVVQSVSVLFLADAAMPGHGCGMHPRNRRDRCSECRGKIRDGVVVFLPLFEGYAAIDIRARPSGIDPDGLGIVGDRLVVLLLIMPGEPAMAAARSNFPGSSLMSSL